MRLRFATTILVSTVLVLPGCGGTSDPVDVVASGPEAPERAELAVDEPDLGEQTDPGCGVLRAGNIVERSDEFTPFGEQRGPLGARPPLLAGMRSADEAESSHLPRSILGLPLSMAASHPQEKAWFALYSVEEVDKEITYVEFLVGGGLILETSESETPAGRAAWLLDMPEDSLLPSGLSEQFTAVDVGPHRAAVNHGDPFDEQGHRPRSVLWTVDGTDHVLTAVGLTAEEIVNAARTIVCGGDR